jgi:hypothetical protein
MDDIKTLFLYKFTFNDNSSYHQFIKNYELCAPITLQYRSLTALYTFESPKIKIPIEIFFSINPDEVHYFNDLIKNFKAEKLIVKSSTDKFPMDDSATFRQI